MLPTVLLSLAAAGAAMRGATTTPAGYCTLVCPGNALTAATVLLEQPPADSGAVGAVSATALTDPAKTWTPAAWAAPAQPHVVQLRSGASAGRCFRIAANTANALTVDTGGSDLTKLVGTGDTYRIRPIGTFGTLFGIGAVPLQSGASASVADNLLLWDAPTQAWLTYFHDGTTWRRTGSLLDQANTPLLPDTALLIFRRGSTNVSVVMTGLVPTIAPRSVLQPGVLTFVGNPQPVALALAGTGFTAAAGWQSGASAATADNVLVWDGGGWLTFYFNGTHWRRSGSLIDQDAFVLAAGTPWLIYRRSAPAAEVSAVTTPLAYTP